MSEVNTFKNREAFLSFLDSIADSPYDNAPVLRNYIARLYYHNDIPALSKSNLLASCVKSCNVLSVDDTEKYIDKLVDIGFLSLASDDGDLRLNTEFYNPDRFAMGTPSVDHAGENKDSDS